MINSISYENFRGLKRLDLPELSQITLITGRNNAGKTSILEGIFLFMDHIDVNCFSIINSFRRLAAGAHPSTVWGPAFYALNTSNPLSIRLNLDGVASSLRYERDDSFSPVETVDQNSQDLFEQFTATSRSTFMLKWQYQQEDYSESGYNALNLSGGLRNVKTNLPNNQMRFLPVTRYISPSVYDDTSVINWLGQIVLKGEKAKVIEALKIIEPDLSDIMTISNQGQMQIYIKVLDQVLPARIAGDGLNRLLAMLCAIQDTPDSIILIDEIDAGIHYSVLENLWNVIAVAAKGNGCQIIATTHSYECIQNAVSGIEKASMTDSFCIYDLSVKRSANS